MPLPRAAEYTPDDEVGHAATHEENADGHEWPFPTVVDPACETLVYVHDKKFYLRTTDGGAIPLWRATA
jgi:hypothetical protein